MNTLEINNYFRNCKKYYGTYPRDMLPKYIPKDSGIIINTDKSSQPGEHWVSIFKTKSGPLVYFDSFGLPPLHKEITDFIEVNTINGWFYNSINFQSIYSDTCGLYCIYFLTNYFNNGDFENIQNVFCFSPMYNDRIAKLLRKW